MGRSPCCSKEGLKRGAWTAQEDQILRDYINVYGEGKWRNLHQRAGLNRCGKSCRLRWLNYLKPDIKRGNISPDEDELIIRLHKLLGNRWSLIAGRLPGRTDNEIKNYWNSHLVKKLQQGNSNTSLHPIKKTTMVESSTTKVKVAPTPTVLSSAPNVSNQDSHVIRTMASRCSKSLLLDPPPLHSTQFLQNNCYMAEAAEPSSFKDGLELFPIEEMELPITDMLLDFNVADICLDDLLNTDFSEVCHFNDINDKDLLPFSDQNSAVTNVGQNIML